MMLDYIQILCCLIQNAVHSASSCIAVRNNVKRGLFEVVDNGSGIEYGRLLIPGDHMILNMLERISPQCSRIEISTLTDNSSETACKVYENNYWKLSNNVTPRPSKGTTVTIHEHVHVSSYRPKHKKDCIDDIKRLMQSLALIYCGSSSMSLRDDSSGQIVMSSGRTKTLSEAIVNVYGGDYCEKLRSVYGTQDQVQIHGVISGASYLQEKITLISLNKTIISRCYIHIAVEKVLQKSSSIRLTKGHSPAEGSHYMYVLNLAVDRRLCEKLQKTKLLRPDPEDSLWGSLIDSLTKVIRDFLYAHNLHKGADNLRRLDAVVSSPLDLSSIEQSCERAINQSAQLCNSDQGFSQLPRTPSHKHENRNSARASRPTGVRAAKKNDDITSLSKQRDKSFEILKGGPSKRQSLPSTITDSNPSQHVANINNGSQSESTSALTQTACWIRKHFKPDGSCVYRVDDCEDPAIKATAATQQNSYLDKSKKLLSHQEFEFANFDHNPFPGCDCPECKLADEDVTENPDYSGYPSPIVWNTGDGSSISETESISLFTLADSTSTSSVDDSFQQTPLPYLGDSSSSTVTDLYCSEEQTEIPSLRSYSAAAEVLTQRTSDGYWSAPAGGMSHVRFGLRHYLNKASDNSLENIAHLQRYQSRNNTSDIHYVTPLRTSRLNELSKENRQEFDLDSMSPDLKQIFAPLAKKRRC